MKIEHKRKAETLVNRLRTPTKIDSYNGELDHANNIAIKLDAIGEALAYLVEKKWAKVQAERVIKQIRAEKENKKHKKHKKSRK